MNQINSSSQPMMGMMNNPNRGPGGRPMMQQMPDM